MTSMKPTFIKRISQQSILIVLLVLVGIAQERTKEFTLEDIYNSSKFMSKGIRGFQWIKGGRAYSYLETDTSRKQTDVWMYDVATGKKSKVVDAAKLVLKDGDQSFRIQNYAWSPDESKIIFT